MPKHILVIQGHPDPKAGHFGHALADAYKSGALESGHDIRDVSIADLEFPLLRSQEEWTDGEVPADIARVQEDVTWANHIVFIYPLWLGTMPALVKGFLEQLLRPGFALDQQETDKWPRRRLKDKSARVIVTMGMPAFVYRWFYLSHSLRSLERNVLRFCGIGPVRDTLVGLVGSMDGAKRQAWLERMHKLGRVGR
jgi:putative NADPH-quinone reductase